MNGPRSRVRAAFLLLLVAACLAVPADAQDAKRRLIVFGIDGADPALFEKYRAEGKLPTFDALARKGSYAPLATANPAQSPVSWASVITGSNPGKTGIYDFLRRNADLLDTARGIELALTSKDYSTEGLPTPRARMLLTAAAGAVPLLLAWLLGWLVLRKTRAGAKAGHVVGILLGLAGAAFAVPKTRFLLSCIPEDLPTAVNCRQGVPLWSVLGQAGVRTIVLEAPVSFPVDRVDNVRMTAGLGAPDAHAHWGLYYLFTDDVRAAVTAETGGLIDHVTFDASGRAWSRAYGPDYPLWTEAEDATFAAAAEEAAIVLQATGLGSTTSRRFEERSHHHVARLAKKFSAVVEIRRDAAARAVTVRVGAGGPRPVLDIPVPARGAASAVPIPDPADPSVEWTAPVTVKEGEWSDRIPVLFRMKGNPLLEIRAFGRFRLDDAGGDGRPFRLVLAPLQFDPSQVLPNVPTSWPREFAPALAAELGPFDTMGWPCLNNPIKDGLLSDEGFVEDIRRITKERRARFLHLAARKDWDVLMGVFAEVDRVQHAFWRHVDPQHPLHRPADAATFAPFIEEQYVAMDGVLKDALAAAGPDTDVIVVSDHGIASFRRSVNLNTFLRQRGFKVDGGSDGQVEVGQLFSQDSPYFPGTDWSKTKAYALGLGQIYINLRGREKAGSVAPEQYDAVCEQIRKALLALRESDGTKVVREVYRGKDIFRGPTAARWAPDLVLGFERGYRVSWQTTLGGGGPTILEDNRLPWSGDHCSVDPSLVPGILVTSFPVDAAGGSVEDIAPTIVDLYRLAPPAEWDGKSLVRR